MRCLKWPSPVRRCATYSCASSCVGDVSCRALLGLDCYKRTCGLPPSDCLRPRLSLKEHDSSLALVLSPQATPSAVVLSCCQKLPYFSRRFHIYIYISLYIHFQFSSLDRGCFFGASAQWTPDLHGRFGGTKWGRPGARKNPSTRQNSKPFLMVGECLWRNMNLLSLAHIQNHPIGFSSSPLRPATIAGETECERQFVAEALRGLLLCVSSCFAPPFLRRPDGSERVALHVLRKLPISHPKRTSSSNEFINKTPFFALSFLPRPCFMSGDAGVALGGWGLKEERSRAKQSEAASDEAGKRQKRMKRWVDGFGGLRSIWGDGLSTYVHN